MAVGPQLPPSLQQKRKREDDGSDSDEDSSSSIGPAPLPASESIQKKARVIGPAMPPAPLNERPSESTLHAENHESDSSGDDDDDDDDFGPSLPPAETSTKSSNIGPAVTTRAEAASNTATQVKRDDWMMVPPSGGDWGSRVDPTKLKNRKFNTGKGAKAPSSSGDATSAWHETPAEKQARLQREMMGIKDTSSGLKSSHHTPSEEKDAETMRRMQEYNKSRGPTLYQAHQKHESVEKDDDPSARAFDREKDIAGGSQINATQRRDMVKKATDFNSRFSSAKYL